MVSNHFDWLRSYGQRQEKLKQVSSPLELTNLAVKDEILHHCLHAKPIIRKLFKYPYITHRLSSVIVVGALSEFIWSVLQ